MIEVYLSTSPFQNDRNEGWVSLTADVQDKFGRTAMSRLEGLRVTTAASMTLLECLTNVPRPEHFTIGRSVYYHGALAKFIAANVELRPASAVAPHAHPE